MISGVLFPSVKRRGGIFLVALALSCGGAPGSGTVHAQGTITGAQTMVATVETIDPAEGDLLLRDNDGGLITIEIPQGTHNLPHLQPGDQIRIRFFQTLDATLAAPDSPAPVSTVSAAHGFRNRHPHGTLISFRRKRVRVIAVDAAQKVVTIARASGENQTVSVQQKAFQPLLSTLKAGDLVDVTTMDAVSFTVMNRVVSPSVTVQEGSPVSPPATTSAPSVSPQP
ncbi:preprotein translocase subunit YajC [Acetobacter musti]|uniref:Preprotein translocase subunit YajC n=1 Tax=Acetobacter musti TaxID=864732 RepID=A0ABX0JXE3_9PROT|nr:preprotein translocase subunit YajC [Acetobacter musti]NHN86154.1 preprotein translocase subunit YajC [Acetobacter musti]